MSRTRLRPMPPLECLLFFEAAARNGSFKSAAKELCVTAAAVAYRIKILEAYFDTPLFVRHSRGVELNRHGQKYLQAIQRPLTELQDVSERHRNPPRTNRLAIVAVEVLAEKWLIPRLADFKAMHPDIAIELETDHREVDMAGRGLDIWLPYANEVRAPLQAETLLEEHLVPVCSPILLEARGRPPEPGDLLAWPLLYDIEWAADWSCWFEHQGWPSPDLSRASGFRLYSMLVQAAVGGMGGAMGRTSMIAQELEQGTRVPLFDLWVAAPARYLLVTTPSSRRKPEVQEFSDWILRQAGDASRAHGPLRRRTALR